MNGVNGAVAPEATPDSIASALVQVVEAGPALRESTLRWFVENGDDLRIERSVELVTRSYAGEIR